MSLSDMSTIIMHCIRIINLIVCKSMILKFSQIEIHAECPFIDLLIQWKEEDMLHQRNSLKLNVMKLLLFGRQ